MSSNGASAQGRSLTRAEIEALLAERDAVIIELENTIRTLQDRVDALEGRLGRAPEAEIEEAPDEAGATRPSGAGAEAESDDAVRLDIDETAAERALERTLVQTGALLLPRGAFELVPTLFHSVSEFDYLVSTGVTSDPLLTTGNLERSFSSVDVAFRIGLPGDSQFEVGIPYRSIDEDARLTGPDTSVLETSETGRGTGDLRIGFAKTLLRENGWRPDLVGRITYGTGSGERMSNGVNLGGGFEYVDASLSFIKRRDPLAMFFALGYTRVQDEEGIDPGDATQVSVGTALAVSPSSSLSGSVSYARLDETEVDGRKIAGSDRIITSLNLSFSTVLRRGTLLNLYTEIGLSEAAPDYSLGFSVPMRW